MLRVVHHWRDVTWANQDAACVKRTAYEWRADRHSSSLADRWRYARLWYERSQRAYPPCQPAYSSGVPRGSRPTWSASVSWRKAARLDRRLLRLHLTREPVPGSGPSIAATYGESWLTSRSAQDALAWSLYQSYGWSPCRRLRAGLA